MRLIDLVGRRYGRLLVIARANKRGDGKKPRWRCLCDCGNETEAYGNNLGREFVTSCGCYRKEFIRANQLPDGVSGFNNLYGDYTKRADEKGISFFLSEEQFRDLTSGDCKYCGRAPQQRSSVREKSRSAYVYNGIDRVDSSKGYCLENCVSCCCTCNYMKLDTPLENFIDTCRKIVERYDQEAKGESISPAHAELVSSD